jgi:signal transduction histidine kinase
LPARRRPPNIERGRQGGGSTIAERLKSRFLPLGLSIERKLPIAFSALLALVLGIYLWLAYREVEHSSRLATSERLSRASAELVRWVTLTQTARQGLYERVTSDSAVRAALRGSASAAAQSALNRLRGAEPSDLPVFLLDAQQRVIRQAGGSPSELAQQHLPRSLRDAREQDRRVVYSRIFNDGRRGYFWSTYAVREGGNTLGYLAQLRTVGSPTLLNPIGNLIGPETSILFGNEDDFSGHWIRLDGSVHAAGTAPQRAAGATQVYERGGERQIASVMKLENTPWMIVLEAPETVTEARAAMFLRRTGLLGLGLIVAGTLVAWLVSRKFTRPMRELGNAAEEIAAGNYTERVSAARTDELGALAAAFNHMAGEVQRSMAESQESRAEAELANRVKSEFLATMSHEIRTPINAMLGYADILDLGISGPLTETQRSQIERIRLSGKHLTSLIEDLLDFARIDTGRLSVRKRDEAANDAIKTALTVVKPQADTKRVNVQVSCDGDLRYLGDSQRVEQILVNLLGNAIKFTDAGGTITLDCRTEGSNGTQQISFAVSDNGAGIQADRLESIFDAFVQGDTGYTRAHGGSGLGLTISRRLARLMDGEINVESTLGEGSRFTLVLPSPATASVIE